jgi:Uncharacterized protein conserved in bacteria
MKLRLIIIAILFLILSSAFFLDRTINKNEYPNISIPPTPDDLNFLEIDTSTLSDVKRKKIEEKNLDGLDEEIIFKNFYSISLGKFKSFELAQKESFFLINKGFKAYLKPSKENGSYELLIGPYVSKSDLMQDQEKLTKLIQKQGSIVDYSY